MKYYDSDRTAFRSLNSEFLITGKGHAVTDFRYFKSVSPEGWDEAEPNLHSKAVDSSRAFHENNLKAYVDMEVEQFPPKAQSNSRFEKSEDGAMREGLSTDPKGVENDARANLDISAGSSQYLCAHASKALKVRSSTTKDRHSKVNTVKGHRDRRVRLALSTAIQLYNLQDRLGLDQPSKVIDWLMSKAKFSIDELHRPSSILELKCSSCNTIRNDGATVLDIVSATRRTDRISHSVPKSLPCPLEKTENKIGSRKAFTEERKVEDLKVVATSVVRPSMLQSRAEASDPVVICTDRKRRSVLLKKVNTQEEVTVASSLRERSGCFDVEFNCFQSQVGSPTDTHSRTPPLPSWETIARTDPHIMLDGSRLPFAVYSGHFDLSQQLGETNNLSAKCTAPLASSLQDKDNIYAKETLRPAGLMNSYINTGLPQLSSNPLCERITSSSTTGSTDGTEVQVNGGGNGLHRLNCQHSIQAFYFDRGLQ